MDLFDTEEAQLAHAPLARRMRPQTLEEFAGQRHLMAPGKLLHRAISSGKLSSLVLYGPPGTGKTALAHLIAVHFNAAFEPLNATAAGTAQVRAVLQRAHERITTTGRRTLLFIDEIHRFNKAQQDVLMPDVEAGNPILIGATTANPSFSIIPALLSRSLVCEFFPIDEQSVIEVMRRALKDPVRGLGEHPLQVDTDALAHIAKRCDGDARRALNALELAALTTLPAEDKSIRITREVAEECLQRKAVVYDADGDAHYDTASAFIKSMRGSDPDAALYWLAKMLYAGEDPRFIARRMVICAAEDVGNADPQALPLSVAAMQATEQLGMPECRIPLAQAVAYIACAPKSNAAYLAIDQALEDVRQGRSFEVPAHLRDAHYKGAKKMGHGEGYKYAHSAPDHFEAQEHLPAKAEGKRYYLPTGLGFEKVLKERLETWRKRRAGNGG